MLTESIYYWSEFKTSTQHVLGKAGWGLGGGTWKKASAQAVWEVQPGTNLLWGKGLQERVLEHQQVHITWDSNTDHVRSRERLPNNLGTLEYARSMACLCLPAAPAPMPPWDTHHLESTTVGRVSELRVPWGRRSHGPGKRHTHLQGSIWMTWGASLSPHSAIPPISKSEHTYLNKAPVRDQIFVLEMETRILLLNESFHIDPFKTTPTLNLQEVVNYFTK